MIVGIEKKLVPIARWVGSALALIAVGSIMMFLIAMGTRAIDALMGWHYELQTIGEFLHRKPPHHNLFAWDRAFLWLVVFFVAFTAATTLEDFIDWAKLPPDVRRREREKSENVMRRAKAEEEAEAERLRSERAARKAAKGPMSGWRRLWIVLSILFGALAAIMAWQPKLHQYAEVSRTITGNDQFWSAPEVQAATDKCGYMRAEAKYAWGGDKTYTYTIDCENPDPFTASILWALFPAFFMAVVGLTVRWIYRGFRRPEQQAVSASD